MGVAGQDHVAIVGAAADKGPLQLDSSVDLVDRVADPNPQIGRNLVVAAAGCVQLSAHVAKPVDQRPFDVHMHVFQLAGEAKPVLLNFVADFLQGVLNLAALVIG